MRKKIEGEGLVETLITLLIIAIGVLGLIRFQNYLTYTTILSRQRSDAITIATQKIEALRDYHVLNTTAGYTAYQDIVSGSSTVTGTTVNYSLVWTVTSFTNPTYKTLNVTVSWTDRNNQAQSVRLISNVAGIDPASSADVM